MKTVPLKHLCTDPGQYGLNVPADQYRESGTRLIRTSDLATGELAPAEDGIYVSGPIDAPFVLNTGDLLLSRSGTIGRAFMVPSAAKGMTFAGFLVRFRPQRDVVPRYLYYCTQSQLFQEQVSAEAITSTIQNFNAERYANLRVPHRSTEEQRRIANFLDDQVTCLDRAIDSRERQGRLARERFHAYLERQLAGHASTWPLKAWTELVTSGPRGWGDMVGDVGSPFLRITNIPRTGIDVLRDDLRRVVAPDGAESTRARTRPGDVLISITADLGSVAVVPDDLAGSFVSQHVALVRPIASRCDARWLAWSIQAPRHHSELNVSGYGGTKVGLGLAEVAELRLPRVALQEQRKLADEVDDAWRRTSRLIELAEDSVSLLEERKRALITAAVTGELEVATASGRGVA